jgi:hypothetical protein
MKYKSITKQISQTLHRLVYVRILRILWYIWGTVQFGIHYSSVRDTLQFKGNSLLVGFTDSDWAGNPNDQKSTAGYDFSLGSRPVT